jgi:hypothetical protein
MRKCDSPFLTGQGGFCTIDFNESPEIFFYHKGTKGNKRKKSLPVNQSFSLRLCASAGALNHRDFAPWRAIFFVNFVPFMVIFFLPQRNKRKQERGWSF